MRAETQSQVVAIKKSIALLAQRMDLETTSHRMEEFAKGCAPMPCELTGCDRAQVGI